MTTVNSPDDLLREDAHFQEQARRLIVTDVLISRRDRFAAFAGQVEDFMTK